MPGRFRFRSGWEIPLVAATSAMALAAVGMLFVGAHQVGRISQSAENNVVYQVMATAPELTRLQATIAARFMPDPKVTDDDVGLRLDIVLNRLDVLTANDARKLRRNDPEASKLVEEMVGAVRSVAPTIRNLRTEFDATRTLEVLEPLNARAARLASLTTAMASRRIADGEWRLAWIFRTVSAQVVGLTLSGLALVLLLRRMRQQARTAAEIDALTGLASRGSFNAAIELAAHRSRAPGSMAVLMLDLDLFKHVNDTLGHAAGDALLREAADRLRPVLKDAASISRLGGDEFAALFVGERAREAASRGAQRVLECFARPFMPADVPVTISTSIGLCVLESGDEGAADLLKGADLALYAAKEGQRGTLQVCDTSLKRAYAARRSLAKDLEHAVARDELRLAFQPIVCLATRRTAGFEALLRWQHPCRGSVSPAEFIPIAEDSGLILPIGQWVIREACRTAANWPGDVRITVNISARQFSDSGLVDCITAALADSGTEAERLTLEITESTLIRDDGGVLGALETLRGMGIRVALDDFGTGYASLSYLTRFPFDVIKIDRSFVQGSSGGANHQVVVQSICDLAGKLGVGTVAEGIETEEHARLAREAGCDLGQGYLFDRPLSAVDCAARLAAERLGDVLALRLAEGGTGGNPGTARQAALTVP
ncbi:putative bifunctional diguanylate cyclase/phosphodiesterase [Antarcticirhabdus aurantiaca]|uniref:Bifunctional diguanylate cyclase/phosphodiesterase n=1 Tax=Antarcticirhabdus aurantiaca TaxID=2606717 RepID=A0ACD4NS38_9HYPH|nr:bifunctional diguanylate cyclase/phosphodiesterase [Antarcticirhabdus aurantiaca]WAJ29471.1 bifunctional diguanylate cyclase/phosphodiesterase [Jeongeuplla avenae]